MIFQLYDRPLHYFIAISYLLEGKSHKTPERARQAANKM